MRQRIMAIIRKEFTHIWREPTTLILIIVIPVIQLVLYSYALTFDIKEIRLAVFDQDRSELSRSLVRKFESAKYFNTVKYISSDDEIRHELESGDAMAVLKIPAAFSADIASGRQTGMQLIVDGANPNVGNLTMGYSSLILNRYAQETLLRGANFQIATITPQARVWYNEELKSVNFIVPGLIAILLMMIPAVLTAVAIVRERETATIEHIIISPLRPFELMFGKIIPYLVVAATDAIIITVVGITVFHVPMRGSFLFFALATFIYMVGTVGIGLLFSTITNTIQMATLLVWLATMLPSFMLSGFVFPIDSMPRVLQYISMVVPARYYLDIARGVFLKGTGMSILWPQVLILTVFAVTFFTISSIRFRRQVTR